MKGSQRSVCSSPAQSQPSRHPLTRESLSKRANYSDGRFARKQMPVRLGGEASDGGSFPDNEACLMSCLLIGKKKVALVASRPRQGSTEMTPINMARERSSGIHVCHFYSSVSTHPSRQVSPPCTSVNPELFFLMRDPFLLVLAAYN